MDDMFFRTALVWIFVLFSGTHCTVCGPGEFKCINGETCLPKTAFCDRVQECEDGSDENYCYSEDVSQRGGCPSNWWSCNYAKKCIPPNFKCDYYGDCFYNEDESLCGYRAKPQLKSWFLRGMKTHQKTSHKVYRTAIALHLSEQGYFASTKAEAQEVVAEVKIQALKSLTSEVFLNRKELALGIQALLVTCNDPRDFYGFNLVAELRAQAIRRGVPLSPPELLALCNVNDTMTTLDVQNVVDAFNSKKIPVTTDNKAMALQALACIQSRTNITLSKKRMTDMQQELKSLQFQNGTVGDLRTTALVLQAFIASHSNLDDFNFIAAMESILRVQNRDGSFGSLVDSYYVMPLLTEESFLKINNSHCLPSTKNETNATEWNQGSNNRVLYSIRMGGESTKTRTLYVPIGSSIYDVIEIVNVLESTQRVKYHVVDDKPYVSSLKNVQEDLEMGLYWYIYKIPKNGYQIILKTESPVDVKLNNNDEILLWYK